MESNASSVTLDTLPEEVLETVADLLLGFDLLALSEVTKRLRVVLRSPSLWIKRINHELADELPVVDRYVRARSLLFKSDGERGGGVPVPRPNRSEFSFAMWFCLRSGDIGYPGGILLGVQSISIWTPAWANYHKHYVHVDTRRNLYCSVFDSKRIVASTLEENRWYHLALTFKEGEQRIYVDGTLQYSEVGSLNSEWFETRNWQIGSGCMSGYPAAQPTPEFCGWYPFQGLIDEYLSWNAALSPRQVQALSNFTNPSLMGIVHRPSCVVRAPTTRQMHGSVEEVRCSRPPEKWCKIVQ
ncbi:hypothetical protein PINS_up015338 [Pythium insidiosum]|nr:hypothetical protein PINS_up015338 [Pythium insidiosum]